MLSTCRSPGGRDDNESSVLVNTRWSAYSMVTCKRPVYFNLLNKSRVILRWETPLILHKCWCLPMCTHECSMYKTEPFNQDIALPETLLQPDCIVHFLSEILLRLVCATVGRVAVQCMEHLRLHLGLTKRDADAIINGYYRYRRLAAAAEILSCMWDGITIYHSNEESVHTLESFN